MHRPILFILIIVVYNACTSGNAGEKAPAAYTSPDNAAAVATPVQTSMSIRKPFVYFIQCNGKVTSGHDQLWKTTSGGWLTTFNGINGKRYVQGAVIAQFDTVTQRLKLEKALLNRFNAEKEYQSLLLSYDNLLKNKSPEEIATIKKKLQISTGLAAAEQDIREIQHELEASVIKAPFTGILADVHTREGQLLSAGQELFRLYDPDNLLLEVKVLEADIPLLKTGMPAKVAPVADTQVTFTATVHTINPYVDANGMVDITLKIEKQRNRWLFPGMNCVATIHVPFSTSLVVPKEAIVMHSNKAVVFTLEDGKARWNYVTAGRENGKEVEIKDGLPNGAKVIISNNLQLVDEAPVEETAGTITRGSQPSNHQ